MNTGEQIPLSDRELVIQKHKQRCENHQPSAYYKSRQKLSSTPPVISVGDLVYLYQDRDKTKAREKYLVTKVHDQKISIQKFTSNQLRSKEYVVDSSDIIKVEPYQFPQYYSTNHYTSSDDDDEIEDHKFSGTDETVERLESSHHDTPTHSGGENADTPLGLEQRDGVIEDDVKACRPKSTRIKKKPIKFKDYVVHYRDSESSDSSETTQKALETQKNRPKRKTKSHDKVTSHITRGAVQVALSQ